MSNLETRKAVGAMQYALDRVGQVESISDLEDAWLAGFSIQEGVIRESLQTLEQIRDNITKSSLSEQLLKSRDLDRINNKIEILQSLL